MSLLPLIFACTGTDDSSVPDSDADTDTDSDTDTDTDSDTDTDTDFNGTVPDVSIPAPEFEVQNMDESPRTREDLLGHATVAWFYPAAGTAG